MDEERIKNLNSQVEYQMELLERYYKQQDYNAMNQTAGDIEKLAYTISFLKGTNKELK